MDCEVWREWGVGRGTEQQPPPPPAAGCVVRVGGATARGGAACCGGATPPADAIDCGHGRRGDAGAEGLIIHQMTARGIGGRARYDGVFFEVIRAIMLEGSPHLLHGL